MVDYLSTMYCELREAYLVQTLAAMCWELSEAYHVQTLSIHARSNRSRISRRITQYNVTKILSFG